MTSIYTNRLNAKTIHSNQIRVENEKKKYLFSESLIARTLTIGRCAEHETRRHVTPTVAISVLFRMDREQRERERDTKIGLANRE